MSRNLTSDTQSRVLANAGQDPVPVVKLTLDTTVHWFSDRDLTQDGLVLEGRISRMGNLQTDIRIDKTGKAAGTVATVDISLLDEDKALLALLDSNDFQGASILVYSWFVGQTQADMVLLLKGRIESAPLWDEKDRCLQITAETPRRVNPVPYAPSEADGLDVDLDHLGKTWPMCFGTPSDVPATPVKDPPRGTLIQDMTEKGQIEDIDEVPTEVETNIFEIDNPDEDFPQGVPCLVKIADEYVLGSFEGNTLTVTERRVNHYTSVPVSGTGAVVRVAEGVRAVGQYIAIRGQNVPVHRSYEIDGYTGIGATLVFLDTIGSIDQAKADFIGYCYKQIGRDCYIWNGDANYVIQNSVADINRYPYESASWVHKAGSPVVVASVEPTWVVNAIPSSAVVRVRAWRQVTHDDNSGFSQNQLVKVPESFYTVNLNNSAYDHATTITMPEMLSDRGGGWSDDLYVTVRSTVGSNTADVIKYLLENHSEGAFTCDADSFNDVADLIENYPSHFAILDQADVLDHVGDIAWQARCGVVWNGAAARLVYLSKEPTTQTLDLTDTNLEEGSIKLSTTPIEDVVTVFNVEWKPNYSDRVPKRLLYRTNVARYGKREQKYSFWIYQSRRCVVKSASFWAMRYGRIWRTAKTKHWGLEGIVLDPFDYARWQVSEFLAPVRGLVTRSNIDDRDTSCEALLPIEAGTLVQSSNFWVSDSGDTAPTLPNYAAGSAAEEQEIIKAPPPEVTTIQDASPQVFHVVADEDENKNPASSEWKKVSVRIISSDEQDAADQINYYDQQIASIDALDPDHLNGTLNAARAAAVSSRADWVTTRDGLVDESQIVTAHNPSASYMVAGDEGTMIKVAGGGYVVTPAGASGPFIVRVTKPPASPAEGTLYADFEGTYAIGASGTQQIQVLGDGSNIKEDDLLLVFRDSLGNYFTQGGGFAGSFGLAVTANTVVDKDTVPMRIWLSGAITGTADLTVTGKTPILATGAKIPAGYYAPAIKLGATWYFLPPMYYSYEA